MFPVARYFETALAAAEQWGLERISILMGQTAELLVWSQNDSYSEAKLGGHFMKNYVFGLLTGPDAPFAREAPPSGFLVLGCKPRVSSALSCAERDIPGADAGCRVAPGRKKLVLCNPR